MLLLCLLFALGVQLSIYLMQLRQLRLATIRTQEPCHLILIRIYVSREAAIITIQLAPSTVASRDWWQETEER